jgi:hypothetical protein
MGERVVVGPATPVEPIVDEPPLEYGRGNRASDAVRVSRGYLTVFFDQLITLIRTITDALGGTRRVAFAIGLGMLLGGLGDCIAGYSRGQGAFWMFIGGMLIGLTVRVPIKDT